jgi:hypothetical protein
VDGRLSRRRNSDFDGRCHMAPPLTWIERRMEPSANRCSVTV